MLIFLVLQFTECTYVRTLSTSDSHSFMLFPPSSLHLFLLAAPSAPTNFSVAAHNDTTLVISFSPPDKTNGILHLFQIQHQLSEVDSEVETLNITVVDGSTLYQVPLSNLNAFTSYSVRVRAATGAGYGPFTTFITRSTLEAGVCVCVCVCAFMCVHVCVCTCICGYILELCFVRSGGLV